MPRAPCALRPAEADALLRALGAWRLVAVRGRVHCGAPPRLGADGVESRPLSLHAIQHRLRRSRPSMAGMYPRHLCPVETV